VNGRDFAAFSAMMSWNVFHALSLAQNLRVLPSRPSRLLSGVVVRPTAGSGGGGKNVTVIFASNDQKAHKSYARQDDCVAYISWVNIY
jgi:hypothetical protein